MLAYDYPILGLFWTMLIIFLWVAWLMLLFNVIIDIFRSDMGGMAKALWALGVIVVPWLGVLVYLIANGSAMGQRQVDAVRASEEQTQAYIRSVAGGAGTADEIAKLAELNAAGALTDAEFAAQKAKLLA
jgi:hypothetical protein